MGSCSTKEQKTRKNEGISVSMEGKLSSKAEADAGAEKLNERSQPSTSKQPENLQLVSYPSKREIEEMNKIFSDNGVECPICLEEYVEGIEKKIIECGHCFCIICISKTLKILPKCPLCRKEIDYNKEFQVKEEPSSVESKSKPIATDARVHDNWNVHTVRNIFSNDNFFNRGDVNYFGTRFGNDRVFNQNRMMFNDRDFTSLARQHQYAFDNDPFFVNARREFQTRKAFDDPFFKQGFNRDAFNDPFFKEGNKNAFNDPFFKRGIDRDAFNDPFFREGNKNAFDDPFFKRGINSNAFNDPFFTNGVGSSNGFSNCGGFGGGFGSGSSGFAGGFSGGFRGGFR